MPKPLSEEETARRRRINRVLVPVTAALFVVLFALLLLLPGNRDSDSDDSQAVHDRPTTSDVARQANDETTTTSTVATVTTTTVTVMVTTTQPVDSQASAISELRTYLRDNFGQPGYETTWYPYIVDLRPIGNSGVDVVTSIYPDGDAAAPAEGVCHGVSGFIFRNGQTVLTGLRVSAQSGHRLALRMSLSDDCSYDG